jgi:two-component system sensor histidine kinase KdpD
VTKSYWIVLGRFVAVAAVLAAIVGTYRHLEVVNPTTVAITLLLAVLVVAATMGLRYAVFLAILATLCFNYYFLPPIGTFTIASPHNWVALFAFLVTAVIASHLSERARRQTAEAHRRRWEAEHLYSLSQRLLETKGLGELFNAIPRFIVETFGMQEAALLLQSTGEVYRSSADGEPCIHGERNAIFMPVRLGVRTVGAYAIVGSLSRETLEALGSLLAIAMESAAAVEKLSKAEAAREGEKLRSALLDSVTHEFRTPLTSIKASVSSLLAGMHLDEAQRRELLTVIDEEADRLNRLVGEAAEMAQLESQGAQLELGLHSMREVADAALSNCKLALVPHPVEIHIPANLPLVRIDLPRATEVLTHLLENAAKYSPQDSPIRITSEVCGREVVTSVADHGPGIDSFKQQLVFDKFYRGREQRALSPGTGMGLAIAKAIVDAHGGTIRVISQLGQGSVFSFSLPISAPESRVETA